MRITSPRTPTSGAIPSRESKDITPNSTTGEVDGAQGGAPTPRPATDFSVSGFEETPSAARTWARFSGETPGLTLAAERAAGPAGPAGPAAPQPSPAAPQQSTAARVQELISYGVTDWAVTSAEQSQVLSLLRADRNLSGTVRELQSNNMLGALMDRVSDPGHRRELVQMLGARTDDSARSMVTPHVARLGAQWEMQFNLGRMGVTSAAPPFNVGPFRPLVSNNPEAPFTGAGASGVNPTQRGVPLTDQFQLWREDPATTQRYSNPIPGDLSAYLNSLSPTDRSRQAELFLRQPISTVDPASYAGRIPSRAQVIEAAARHNNIEPELLAGFLLAEQRDQSANEDAKDYVGATRGANTSVGLGQVVISTARRNDLFQDLLSPGTRGALSDTDTARLLASDEYNIFAAARYIRQVADEGSRLGATAVPGTRSTYPDLDLGAYRRHSSSWPRDNIRALGSEYTSRAWDDRLSTGWGNFVLSAYDDVRASGVFPEPE
ncbi:hypothetical protein HPC49_08200 [Pyxidicoccus fallax]|uniref:Uncharacterized protein n=1 Tax=Pyxidicoccus fallax TaxID=394095 RepID=A0A848L942_9BACT|nr:hypothetical protein [Pyxidicoccus fallax]NMO15077.1 hypothetical protein [Pyxidicoccus fallax]NPC78235.1 hypothetical protein [Pyxidicoccus fallax]